MEVLDFSIRQGRGRGLTFTLVPFDNEPVLSEAVHVAEIPFGLVEYCIVQVHQEYKNYGHWANTKIPANEWILITKAIKQILLTLERSSSSEDLSWLKRHFATLFEAFVSDFVNTRAFAVALLCQIIPVIENWCARYEWVCIEGV